MTDRFARALPLLLAHEGGYSNHPDDPGGATNMGITQRTYDEWLSYIGSDAKNVRAITRAEVAQIYRARYWDAVKADSLPDGVGYAVFDAGVNSGPARAARWLQAAVGAPVDGVIGPQTLAAVQAQDPARVVGAVCDARLAFMRSLKHWSTFKNGWTARVSDVRAAGLKFASGTTPAPASSPLPTPAARGDVSITAAAQALAKSGPALKSVGGVITGAAALAVGDGPVQWAIAASLLIAVVAAALLFARREMSRAAA